MTEKKRNELLISEMPDNTVYSMLEGDSVRLAQLLLTCMIAKEDWARVVLAATALFCSKKGINSDHIQEYLTPGHRILNNTNN